MNETLVSCPPLALSVLTGVRVRSFDLTEPFIDLAARFAHLPGTVVLLSGGDLDCARYHILGIWPWLTLRGRSGRLAMTVDNQAAEWDSACLDALGYVVQAMRLPSPSRIQPLAAGLLGYLAYDLKDDLEAFEELMDSCRSNTMAVGNATNPIIFEPMIMSILLSQQKRIRDLEKKLNINQQAASIPEPEQAQEN